MCAIKVVHISTSRFGGAGRAAYRIHEALLKSGVDSSFLTLEDIGADCGNRIGIYYQLHEDSGKRPNFVERQKNRIRFRIKKHLNIIIKSKKDREREARITSLSQFNAIRGSLECEFCSLPFSSFDILQNNTVKQADIIHLHWVAEMLDYPSFFINNKKPVVWTLHDMNPFQGLFHYKGDKIKNKKISGDVDEMIQKIKQKAIKKSKSNLRLVTPSLWLLKEVRESIMFRKGKSCSIPYPIDTNIFNCSQNKSELKKLNGIPENNIVFLFIAQAVNNYRKGFDLLAEAFEKLAGSFTLLVLGEGKNFEITGVDIRNLGSVADNEKLRDYYSLADAFIIPSREDNLPNVMLESLACGTPVIGFPVGGIKEHVIDFETGLLAENMSSESLALAIDNFCKNKNRFKREVIREYAEEKYNEELIAGQYIKVYEKVLKKRKFYA
jgi:glycosyltransferase involved in cell wall biosynthesis